jgi:hypothetical protein
MDILQIALIFLIMLLGVFLTITGVQVFLILKDLKKALDKFNNVLESGEKIVHDIEKPAEVVSSAASAIESGVKTIENGARVIEKIADIASPKPKSSKPRFYKKILK